MLEASAVILVISEESWLLCILEAFLKFHNIITITAVRAFIKLSNNILPSDHILPLQCEKLRDLAT